MDEPITTPCWPIQICYIVGAVIDCAHSKET